LRSEKEVGMKTGPPLGTGFAISGWAVNDRPSACPGRAAGLFSGPPAPAFAKFCNLLSNTQFRRGVTPSPGLKGTAPLPDVQQVVITKFHFRLAGHAAQLHVEPDLRLKPVQVWIEASRQTPAPHHTCPGSTKPEVRATDFHVAT
jgi:hypothetical protein